MFKILLIISLIGLFIIITFWIFIVIRWEQETIDNICKNKINNWSKDQLLSYIDSYRDIPMKYTSTDIDMMYISCKKLLKEKYGVNIKDE